MKLLVLGGTVFLGRAVVESALERGHEVTLFNRGQHNPELFPEVEKLRGDRDGDMSALEGRRWDAVIDTSGYVPRMVRASAQLLEGSIDQYTFISTVSVYDDLETVGLDEDGPLATLEDESVEEVTGETYGGLKVLCERAVQDTYRDKALVIRPGLIVGPHDPTDRFTYWPHRIAAGGEVLAPSRPGRSVQIIDARDLADWNIRMIEDHRVGVYNAVGPERPITLGHVLDISRQVSESHATFTWVDEAWLLSQGVTPWSELPLWMVEEGKRGFFTNDVSRAVAEGLRFRPLEQIIRDTWEWARTRPAEYEWRAGLKREREAEILEAWHQR